MAEPDLLPDNEKSIVIVGGGIAGLACAWRLKDMAYGDLTLLEARDRVGGRIHTEHYGEHFIEMGAQWIHGEKNNSIFKIAQENDLVDTYPNYSEEMMTFRFIGLEERQPVQKMISVLERKIYDISDKSSNFPSIQNYLDYSFEEFTKKYTYGDRINCIINRAYEWYCKFLCEHNGCISLSELSLPLFHNYKECDGNPTCELKYGYSSIIDLMLKKIPPNCIETNKIVVKIDWSEFRDVLKHKIKSSDPKYSPKVKIICNDGYKYVADHVVVTLPLGYLKRHSKFLFYPPLSISKQTAIDAVGFGVLNKIYLEFETPFWKAPDVFTVLWNKSFDDILTMEGSYKNLPHLKSWTHHVNRFAYTQSHPKMLCAWVASKGAIDMESLSREEIVKDCMILLEALLGKKLPLPCKVIKSSWMSDPFSCGSFSYLSTECDEKNVSNSTLAEPEYSTVHNYKYPVLLFAGEACHDYHFSTVHGAYETGLREADRILSCETFDVLCKSFDDLTFLGEQEWDSLKNFEVVIIGAGISGLACAVQLVTCGFKRVKILEAEEKVGGRISSVYCGNQVSELGAQWIHGMDNELFEFSFKNQLLQESYSKSAVEGEGVFCTSDGLVIPEKIVIEVKEKLNQAKIELEKGNYGFKTEQSVMSFLSEAFESYLENSSFCVEEKLIRKSLFNWYIKFEVIDNGCDNLNNIAIESYTEWDGCPDEFYHLEYKSGFSSVVDTLVSKLPTNLISLNTPVKTVSWNKDFKLNRRSLERGSNESFPVILECKDGKKIYADTVIVTASAGFLKENLDTFFIPSLPDEKIKAFERIGFGTINKIFLEYDKPFWSSGDLGFQLVWTIKDTRSEKLLKENPWVYGITGFDVKNESNVLVGWIGGEEAKLMEAVSEETVKVVCTELLRMFLNRSDIPIPSKILRSCWFKNPYVKGAYSNRTPDYYQHDATFHDLQYPLCAKYVSKLGQVVEYPIVMFAGEAMDKTSFSSAHGAFQSGMKTANFLYQTGLEVLDSENVVQN